MSNLFWGDINRGYYFLILSTMISQYGLSPNAHSIQPLSLFQNEHLNSRETRGEGQAAASWSFCCPSALWGSNFPLLDLVLSAIQLLLEHHQIRQQSSTTLPNILIPNMVCLFQPWYTYIMSSSRGDKKGKVRAMMSVLLPLQKLISRWRCWTCAYCDAIIVFANYGNGYSLADPLIITKWWLGVILNIQVCRSRYVVVCAKTATVLANLFSGTFNEVTLGNSQDFLCHHPGFQHIFSGI